MEALGERPAPSEVSLGDRTPWLVGRLGLRAEFGQSIPEGLDRGVVREQDLEGAL